MSVSVAVMQRLLPKYRCDHTLSSATATPPPTLVLPQMLLRKHEAVVADVEAFSSTVDTLEKQCKKCTTFGSPRAPPPPSGKQYVVAMYNYRPKTHREVVMKKGDTMVLLNAVNKVHMQTHTLTVLGG